MSDGQVIANSVTWIFDLRRADKREIRGSSAKRNARQRALKRAGEKLGRRKARCICSQPRAGECSNDRIKGVVVGDLVDYRRRNDRSEVYDKILARRFCLLAATFG